MESITPSGRGGMSFEAAHRISPPCPPNPAECFKFKSITCMLCRLQDPRWPSHKDYKYVQKAQNICEPWLEDKSKE
jgi:hypothetical protein